MQALDINYQTNKQPSKIHQQVYESSRISALDPIDDHETKYKIIGRGEVQNEKEKLDLNNIPVVEISDMDETF